MDKREDLAATILYVDDEEMACKYFERSASAEYDVLTASSADAAMTILRAERGRIGVVLTDFRMPGRDGGDLLRQIEREYPHVVRILITAYADKKLLIETVNSASVFRILEKPLDLSEVRRALRLATDLSRERATNRQRLQAINETLAFLAHELNTPLATMLNFSRGIVHRASENIEPLPLEEISKAAQGINDNARYCMRVLSAFVDSARNAGNGFVGEGGSPASQLLAALLDTYPLSVQQRSMITVEIRQDFRITDLPNCIVLVLSSLLSNAVRALKGRATPQLKVTILLDAEPHIEFADNGPGIPPEVLERLLVDPVTTHAAAGGTGCGLLFCNRIMQSFGGGMTISSVPEQCTTVTLNFPAPRKPSRRSAR
jgi:two-component system response regulator PhcR